MLSHGPGFRRECGNGKPLRRKLVNIAGLLADVIHEQVLAEGVWSGEIGFAAAKLGNFLYEMYQAVVAGEHEGVDQNSSALALGDFFEGLGDDQRIEAEGVLVDAAIFESKRGRLA